MEPRSPLEYSRDRERTPEGRGNQPDALSGRVEPSTALEAVGRALERVQRHAVPNPRGRKAAPAADREPSRTGASGPEQAGPRRNQTDLPIRRSRTKELTHTIGLQTRPEEQRLLVEVGKFRVIAVSDLAKEIYGGQEPQLRRDLAFLKQNGLVETHFLNVRRDGKSADVRRFEAVTLTKAAQKLLGQSGLVPEGQRIYSGLVKPREAEHDAQIYRAYLKEAAGIERSGGNNLRVKLDFELKAQLNRAVYLARKKKPGRDVKQVKAEVAQQFSLKVIQNKVVVPDLRIEYDLPSGGSAQLDVEVATAAYRHSHIAHKAQAGFRVYVSRGDIGRLGAAVQDDQDLMSEILDI